VTLLSVRYTLLSTITSRRNRPLRAEEPLGQSAKAVFRWPHANAHEYKKGDLLIIDDRASLHKAGFDYDHSQHRRLYRMLVRGDRPC
jgi:alpha-ketoglutarate-dependent taurine dioxygenase